MPINKYNIAAFIARLYLEKKGQTAPEELLNSWSQLSDADIDHNLTGLFLSWGMTESDKDRAIRKFLNQETSSPSSATDKYKEQSAVPAGRHTQASSIPPPQQYKERKRGPRMWWIILIPALAGLGYLGYQYFQYSNLHRVYAITQNIAIRDRDGKLSGRMDLFSDSATGSLSSMRTMDKEIYFIQPEGSNKEYPSRKVMYDSVGFKDFLFRKNALGHYVNVNYLVEDRKEFRLFQNAFSEIQNVPQDNGQLNAAVRKVIVGAMARTNNMEDAYLITHSDGLSKNILNITSSLIIQTLKPNEEFLVIGILNDGKYYTFEGNIKSNQYKPLTEISLLDDNKNVVPLSGQYRFIQSDGIWRLYNVNEKSSTHYHLTKDEAGKYSMFEYNPPEVITPNVDIFDSISDVLNNLFN